MKMITKCGAQGDVLFRRVKSLPDGSVSAKQEERIVVAHSETGHHHAIEMAPGIELFTTPDPLVSYLRVRAEHADVVHHRPWDTHETLRLYSEGEPEVIWEIRRQQEFTPEGWRVVAD